MLAIRIEMKFIITIIQITIISINHVRDLSMVALRHMAMARVMDIAIGTRVGALCSYIKMLNR